MLKKPFEATDGHRCTWIAPFFSIRVYLCASVIIFTLSAYGQQQPQVATSGSATFRTGTTLIPVDVTVKDKSGKVIEGLKASDFTVLEDGKPQRISIFEFQKLASDPEPPPTLTLADQFKLPESPKTTITVAAPGQVQYHNKRLMTFFFDFSSMQVPEQLRAQEAALKFLDKQITKDDLVAILQGDWDYLDWLAKAKAVFQ